MIPVYGFGEPYNTTDSSTDHSLGNSPNQPTNQSTPTSSTGTTNSSENESKAPRGDLPNWKQIFVDDFDEYGNVPVGSFSGCNNSPDSKQAFCSGLSEPLRSRWWAYPKGWPDTARQRGYTVSGQYNPDETVSIEDGKLKVVMRSDGKENQVAALLPKAAMEQTYGRYAIRFRADPTPGYKIAWLLWPVDDKACDKCEIDFPETELDREIMGYIHPKGGGQQLSFATNQTVTDWHTAVIEWSPGKIEFFLDGQKVNSVGNEPDVSSVNIPDQPMNWVIQSESALDPRAQSGQVVAQSGSTATILIDWVAVYSFTGDGAIQDPQDTDTHGQTQTQNMDDQNVDQPQQQNPNEQRRTEDQPQNNDEQGRDQHQPQNPNDQDQQPDPDKDENRRDEDQQNIDEDVDQDQQPKSNDQDQDQKKQRTDDEQKKNLDDEPKKDQEKQQDANAQKQEQKKPEITIHSVIVDDEQVEITANLEGANAPKGDWLIYFNNDEPKRYEDQGATIKDTFDTRNIKGAEVPVTVEFDGKDADDHPIQVKTIKDVKVKDSEDAIQEELIRNTFVKQDIGGKLPKTATNYHQQIAIGMIFVLAGLSIFALLAVRKQENA